MSLNAVLGRTIDQCLKCLKDIVLQWQQTQPPCFANRPVLTGWLLSLCLNWIRNIVCLQVYLHSICQASSELHLAELGSSEQGSGQKHLPNGDVQKHVCIIGIHTHTKNTISLFVDYCDKGIHHKQRNKFQFTFLTSTKVFIHSSPPTI